MTVSPSDPVSTFGSVALPPGWPRFGREWSAQDYALAMLIDSLRMETFHVGERLPNLRELAATLGLSHVPVRDALDTLEAEGIVEVRRGRAGGIFVSGITGFPRCLSNVYREDDPSTMDALIDARAVLERESAARAIKNADPAGLDALDRLLVGMTGAIDQPEVVVELSVRLELRLAALGGNPVLMEYTRDVLNRMAVLALRTSVAHATRRDLERAVETYTALVRGVRRGSTRAVYDAIDRHIDHLHEVVSREVTPTGARGMSSSE